MRVLSASVQNFGSYKELTFDFTNQGLTLIQGATGSGKSTLCDIIPWILFGATSKRGKVDEIRSWNTKGTTSGTINLDNGFTITRTRSPNDLYFSYEASDLCRGRDLGDTQKIINEKLGISLDLYLAGAYFHEFSQTAQFFTTTAKNRRQICEQIVNLTLATKLSSKLSETHKNLKDQEVAVNKKLDTLSSEIHTFKTVNEKQAERSKQWEERKATIIKYLETLAYKFEQGREKVITNVCSECGTKLSEPKVIVDKSQNPHLSALELKLEEKNPYTEESNDYREEIDKRVRELVNLNVHAHDISTKLQDNTYLLDIIPIYRSKLIENTINCIQSDTNDLLTRFFDAEIKVNFSVTEADKLEVEIQKDSNIAAYTQLSKGQRQMLKLCFGVSVMKQVSNNSGIHFNQIFLDESLDGMDDNFKIKAFRLLEELSTSYESVFVVEHSETLKNMFGNSYKVQLNNGHSTICQH